MNKLSKIPLSPWAAMADGIRSRLFPRPELPAEAYALVSHFRACGIQVEPKSLRPRKPGIKSVFDLHIRDYSLPILVLSCVDLPAAEAFLQEGGGDRARAFPRRNGRLVMYLPYWEADDGLTEPVIAAFVSFRAEG